MRKYFDAFKFKSLVTAEFKTFFEDYFKNNTAVSGIDWDTWENKTGMPDIIPDYDTSYVQKCEEIKSNILGDFTLTENDVNNLTSSQLIHLLQTLINEAPLSANKLDKLQKLFNLKEKNNAEIKFRWYRLSLIAKQENEVDNILNWITEVGRMKYVRPLYRDLYSFEKVRPKAIENFKKYRSQMMFVSAHTVAKDLKLD